MCQIDLYDDAVAEVWSETVVTARKPHRCDCCLSDILPREKYLKHWSLFDGEQTHGKLCRLCERDRLAFSQAHHGILSAPQGFQEMLEECITEGDEESEKNWSPMLQRIKKSKQNYRDRRALTCES